MGHSNSEIVHVQSVLPQEDVIALKLKTGESSIKEAISKAVYHYLSCEDAKKMTHNTFELLDPSLTTLLSYQELVDRIGRVERAFYERMRLLDYSEFGKNNIGFFAWCDIRNVFQVMSCEFIDALADEIRNIDPEVIVEVGAGRGSMGKYLSEALNREIILTDDHTYWTTEKLPESIKIMDYRKAIQTYNPDLVIASWIPHGSFWTGFFRDHPSVKGYILMGESPGTCTGSELDLKTDWEIIRLRKVEQYSILRTDMFGVLNRPITHAYIGYFKRPNRKH